MSTEAGEAALRQLLELIEVSDGALALLDQWDNVNGTPVFSISMDTSGIEQKPAGIAVRHRERFNLVIPAEFPFEPPSAWAAHKRWAKTPHVQWGSSLCLYAATAVEWNPADGMRGFIARLIEWVERAAAGTLDPDGQPLHPPAVYSSASEGTVLVHPDLGERVPWYDASGRRGDDISGDDGSGEGGGTELVEEPVAPRTLFAWCSLTGRRRLDVLEWVDADTALQRARDPQAPVFNQKHPVIALPVVLSPDEFGFEFPEQVSALSAGLAESGYDRERMLADLGRATVVNRLLLTRQVDEDPSAAGAHWDKDLDDPGAPLLTAMIVGTPSRRIEGTTRLAHLAAWRVDAFSADVVNLIGRIDELGDGEEAVELGQQVRELALGWFDIASVGWMRVMENRPEVTQRRDHGTPSTWLSGKRVLVLGCGALGAPVAEHCVRAGVSALTVADKSSVKPGILVRQPYADADIGRSKATALAKRLSKIRTDLTVEESVGNVRTEFFGADGDLSAFDLVIDATADSSVRAAIEKARRQPKYRAPLVTMVIGHDATRGLVTTNTTGASGAAADTFRKVALLAADNRDGWSDIGRDLFPASPRTESFFPEPGCSEPTFVGSAAQTTALASLMLHEALMVLDRPLTPGASASFASAVRLGTSSTAGTTRAEWAPDLVRADASGNFEVRISGDVMTEMRAEARRGARVRHPAVETGGMLLGSFDDAVGVVYVDKATGPPPDSYLAESYFQHGIEGVRKRVEAELDRTNSVTGFVGFWHTHPDGPARPSDTDEQGMASIVGPDGTTRRALMLILGGPPKRWRPWRDGNTRETGVLPDVYLRVVPRSTENPPTGVPLYVGGLDLQLLPAGAYFRGGFSSPVRVMRGGRVEGPRGSKPTAGSRAQNASADGRAAHSGSETGADMDGGNRLSLDHRGPLRHLRRHLPSHLPWHLP